MVDSPVTPAKEAIIDAFADWNPSRPPLTHRQFAPLTKLPGGPLKGSNYDPATDPVQSYLLDQLDSGKWRSVFWTAPPQIAGKTQVAILVPSLRAVIELRAAVGYGLPTLNDLDRGWTTKIAPTIKGAGFEAYLPSTGPGSRGGRSPAVVFEDPQTRAPLGSFVFLAGGAKQVTCRCLVVDEIDAWRKEDGEPRWNDLDDVWARGDSFGRDAIRIGVGTVECDDPKQSIVLRLVNEIGTGTRMHHRCPHCGKYNPSEFSQFSWEYKSDANGPDLGHAAASAHYTCKECSAPWTEDDRRKALLASVFAHKGQSVDSSGTIIGDPPRTESLGLRTHALDCILTTMSDIAERECVARHSLETHDNHEAMRKFWRYQRVEGYQGDQQKDEHDQHTPHTHRTLHARSLLTANHFAPEILREDKSETGLFSRYFVTPPPAVTRVVAAIDVQRNRLYTVITGMDDQRRTYDIGWSIEYARPSVAGAEPPPFSPGDLAKTLEQAADWAEDSIDLKIWMGGVVDVSDPGEHGNAEVEIIDWLVSRKGWNAIQGEAHLTVPMMRNHYKTRTELVNWNTSWRPRARLGSFHVVTDNAQRLVQKSYLIEQSLPGAGLLPGGIQKGSHFLRHLCAVGEIRNKKEEAKWGKLGSGRFDWMDCRAYATAILLMHYQLATTPPPRATARRITGTIGV
jgi:hypothetical protein